MNVNVVFPFVVLFTCCVEFSFVALHTGYRRYCFNSLVLYSFRGFRDL